MSYNTKNYSAQGGEEMHVGGKVIIESGGTLEVASGGAIDIKSGGTVTALIENQAASTATTVAAAVTDLNALLTKLKASGLMEADATEASSES